MLKKKTDIIAGDVFRAILVRNTPTEVDPEGFVKLWEKGKITRAQFISAIKVSIEASAAVAHPDDIKKITSDKSEVVQIRFEPLQKAPIEVVDAIKALSGVELD